MPVMPLTQTPVATETAVPGTVRYALTDMAATILSRQDIESLLVTGTVTIVGTLEETLGYDLGIATQPYADGEMLPRTAELAVEVNAAESPLDDPVIRSAIEAVLSTDGDPTTIREDLANAGYPDGITLYVTAQPPELMAFMTALVNRTAAYSILIQPAPSDEHHLLLRLNPEAVDVLIPLETISLYYRASPDLSVTISPNGLPVAVR
jgi:hypothetical protein